MIGQSEEINIINGLKEITTKIGLHWNLKKIPMLL